VSATDVGVLARDAPPPIPRGVAAPDRPKLFVTFQEPERKPEGERLAIAGRGFTPGQDIILRCREFEQLQTRVRADGQGQFTTTLALPESFPHGTFTLEADSAAGKLTASEFHKPFSDEELDERDRVIDRHPPKR
jgi:hypothetical protein